MRNSSNHTKSGSALGGLPSITGEIPAVGEVPTITGDVPMVGSTGGTERLTAQIPGANASAKGHDKAQQQAERGYMPQHGKPSQPQPRWNLPRRRG